MFSNKYHSISAAVLAATAGHVAGQNVFDAADAPSAGWQPDGHYVLKECAGGDPTTCADIKTEPLCAANKTCHWDGSTCQKGSAPPTKTCSGMSQAECAASSNPVCHWDGSCKPGAAPPSSKVKPGCGDKGCEDYLVSKGTTSKGNKQVVVVHPDDWDGTCTGCLSATQAKGSDQLKNGVPGDAKGDYDFGESGQAFVFLPGTYDDLPVKLGLNTEFVGVGPTPQDTIFQCTVTENGGKVPTKTCSGDASGPFYEKTGDQKENVTNIFWRAASNFLKKGDMNFTVSQAAPLRRMEVENHFNSKPWPGYASGFYMSNSKTNKNGSMMGLAGQQYYFRNSDVTAEPECQAGPNVPVPRQNGNMNNVFENCVYTADPKDTSKSTDLTSFGTCAVDVATHGQDGTDPEGAMAEKPYIYKDSKWHVCLPAVKVGAAQGKGADHSKCSATNGDTIVDFDDSVYIVSEADELTDIMQAFKGVDASKKVVLLLPGLYALTKTLEIPAGVTLLGIGYPTLDFAAGVDVGVSVPDTTNTRLAGLMMQPHSAERSSQQPVTSPEDGNLQTLVQWGSDSSKNTNDQWKTAGVMSDVFLRTIYGKTKVMMDIKDDWAIVDHTWVWVADHQPVCDGSCIFSKNGIGLTAENGIVVSGKNASLHGIFAEHMTKDVIKWSGENGLLVFQQTELNYFLFGAASHPGNEDVTFDCNQDGNSKCWGKDADNYYAGLNVSAQEFKSYGAGAYLCSVQDGWTWGQHGPAALYVQATVIAPNVPCANLQNTVGWVMNDSGGNFGSVAVCKGAQDASPQGGKVDHNIWTVFNKMIHM